MQLEGLTCDPSKKSFKRALSSEECGDLLRKHNNFKDELRNGKLGKTLVEIYGHDMVNAPFSPSYQREQFMPAYCLPPPDVQSLFCI